MALERSATEVGAIIQHFIEGTGGQWDWDDFVSIPVMDPSLENVRRQCVELPNQYPPTNPEFYCNESGIQKLRELMYSLSGASNKH